MRQHQSKNWIVKREASRRVSVPRGTLTLRVLWILGSFAKLSVCPSKMVSTASGLAVHIIQLSYNPSVEI